MGGVAGARARTLGSGGGFLRCAARRDGHVGSGEGPLEHAQRVRVGGGDLGAVTWVRPELVMRAELGGWTREGLVRQTSFKGIDEGHEVVGSSMAAAVSSFCFFASGAAVPPDAEMV